MSSNKPNRVYLDTETTGNKSAAFSTVSPTRLLATT